MSQEVTGAVTDAESQEAPAADPETQRRRIFAAAEAEFRAHGFHLTTMHAIARRAACSKKTIYKLFTSKEDLFFGLLDLAKVEVHRLEIDRALPPQAALTAFLNEAARLLLDESAIASMRMAMAEYTHSPALLEAAEHHGSHNLRLALEDYMEELERSGAFRFGQSADAARMLMGMAIGAFHHELLLGIVPHFPDEVLHARIEKAASIFLKGCAV
jgi:AcrR family transcriptional regulator